MSRVPIIGRHMVLGTKCEWVELTFFLVYRVNSGFPVFTVEELDRNSDGKRAGTGLYRTLMNIIIDL